MNKKNRSTEEKFRVSVYFSTRKEAESFKNLLKSCNYSNADIALIPDPVIEGKTKVSEVFKNGR